MPTTIPSDKVSEEARKWWFHVTPKDTQIGGLMIVGIEGGLAAGAEAKTRDRWDDWCVEKWNRFYIKEQQAKYRTRNIEWLKILGYDIKTDEPTEIEDRIQSTNWLLSENRSDSNPQEALVESTEKFLKALYFFKPKVIMLMGKRLSVVLDDLRVQVQFENKFGKLKGKSQWTRFQPRGRRAFNFSYREFERCKVLGLPHPTGSHGLSDQHLAELPEPMLGQYKEALKTVFESKSGG